MDLRTLTIVLLCAMTLATGAGLTITQVQANAPDTHFWIVKGLATFEVGVTATIYHFHCTTTNGPTPAWSRQGGDLGKTQTMIAGGVSTGVSLQFTNPSLSDAGIFICSRSGESVTLNITLANPAVQAVTPGSITALKGDPVSIEFYTSGLPNITASNVAWLLNGVAINSGNFSFHRRILSISSISVSHEGNYTFVVSSVAAASTILIVLVPPSYTLHPLNNSEIIEWTSFTLTCTVTGSLPIIIGWFKVDGSFPADRANETNTAVIGANTLTSVLTVTNARVSDSGLYRCNSSFPNGDNIIESDLADINIKGSIRNIYHTLEGSSVVISSLLLVVLSSQSFYVECQGSGDLVWTLSDGTNVSSASTDIPHQITTTMSFQRLNFTSFSSQYDRQLYTCSSTLGTSSTVYITSDNPAIYTSRSIIIVNTTGSVNITIPVYISGFNPMPTANDIVWYYNGNLILISQSPHYELEHNVLKIQAPSPTIVGTYEAKVSTAQGYNSLSINISYPDPPLISLVDQKVVIEGDNVTLHCNVTSSLDVVVIWSNYNQYSLSEGQRDAVLVLNDVTRDDAGMYHCTVSNGIVNVTETIQLFVQYSPMVTIGSNTTGSILSVIITERSIPSPFYCNVTGFPVPSAVWRFKGNQSLPDGVSQVSRSEHYMELYWTRPAIYSDEGQYSCIATNEVNMSVATFNVFINATPTIYSIFATHPALLVKTTPITFSCPLSQYQCNISCIARSWPPPLLNWKYSNGDIINSSYIIDNTVSGVVTAIMEWNRNNSLDNQFLCEAINIFGSTTQTIYLVDVAHITPLVPIPNPPVTDNTYIKLRLRLLTSVCESMLVQLTQSLLQIISSLCKSCDTVSLMVLESGCGLNGSTLFLLNLSSPNLPVVYNAIAHWWTQGPIIFLNNHVYAVDQECDFLVQESNPTLICGSLTSTSTPIITSSSVPPPSSTDSSLIIIVPIVAVIIVLLVIIIVLNLLLVLYLYKQHKTKSTNKVDCDLVDFKLSGRSEVDKPDFIETTHVVEANNQSISDTRQLHTTTPNQVDTLLHQEDSTPHHYDEVSNSNLYDQIYSHTSYTDTSPTRRITQVSIQNSDYQFPFQHHQYATLKEVETVSDRGLSPSSDMQSPPTPYLEPIPSVEDLSPIKFFERQNLHGLTLPPLIHPLPIDSTSNDTPWYTDTYEDDIVTPTLTK